VEWRLFEAAVASSTTRLCGRKRLGVANNRKRISSWWNKEVKDAIRAKKVAYKQCLQKKAESSLHTPRRGGPQPSRWESPKSTFEHEVESITGKPKSVMANHPASPRQKTNISRSIKDQNGVLLRNDEDMYAWQFESVFQSSFESSHCHIRHTQEAHLGEENTISAADVLPVIKRL